MWDDHDKGQGRRHARAPLLRMLLLALALPLLLAARGDARKDRREPPLQAALREQIAILASDEFGGREPGTPGETKTLKYLAGLWFDIGLESGTNDPGHAWFVPVDLVARRPAQSRASFLKGKRRFVATPDDVFVVTSGLRSLADNAPLFFVGDGTGPVPARQELAGRIAVLLDSLPAGADPDRFADRAGRLLDGGASAVLTVLDGDRGMADLRAFRGRAAYGLKGGRQGGDIEAWASAEFVERLLAGGTEGGVAGLRATARAPGFVPRPLAATATLEATSRESQIHTHNLIGKLAGRNPDAGAVMLVAHWDHFGVCGADGAKETICNGAVDNASGVAVISAAAALLSKGRQPERDIYFLATTGEELGLLGAQAFAESPPVPLRKLVAVFNVDSVAIAPAGSPFAVLGAGRTGLDPGIEAVAKRTKRKLVRPPWADAMLKRQDGWAFLQHDVPAVEVSTALTDQARLDAFMDTRYHRPADKMIPGLELGGAADDVGMLVDLARYFADPLQWPMSKGAG